MENAALYNLSESLRQPGPTAPPESAQDATRDRGRPRFDDPTDPAQIWAICNQRVERTGKARKTFVVFLGEWLEIPKSKIKSRLQNLPAGVPVNARLENDHLLIG